MNIFKIACLTLALAGHAAIAAAEPKLVPHRGLWKNYNNSKVAENSVESYKRVADNKTHYGYTPEYTEIDTRAAKIDGTDQIIVFHDNFWGRLTDYQNDTGDWGLKAFEQQLPPNLNSLSLGITGDAFDKLFLRRSKSGGKTSITNDRVLRLKDFIEQTTCDDHPKIILDIQTAQLARLAANVIANNNCPHGTMHAGNSFANRVHLKLFVSATMPSDTKSTVSSAKIVDHIIQTYGASLNYWFQFNSSQFEADCYNSNCRLNPRINSSENQLSTTAYLDSEAFMIAAMNHQQVMGIALSKPAYYQHNSAGLYYVSTTIEDLFHAAQAHNQTAEKYTDLMSIASRPEDYVMWKSKSRNGSAATQGKKNRCMPFVYRGDGLGVLFFAPAVYQTRNTFAQTFEFDYMVADGYIDPNGKIGSELDDEIRYMCGGDTRITTKFIINRDDDFVEQVADYKLMINETDDYYWLDTVKGKNQIAGAYD